MFLAVATERDGTWVGHAPGIAGTHTTAGTLADLDVALRWAVAIAIDLPEGTEDDLEFEWRVD